VNERWLLDTNILSEPLKPRPDPEVLRQLEACSGRLVTAAPVLHELWFGAERLPAGRRRSALMAFVRDVVFPSIPVLPYEREAARWHAAERARLAAQGRTPAFVDGQIAAVASVNGCGLVTRNGKDFEGFEGVEIVDWA
jgi:tRNA(fMet)-specific endonuclease VapC